MTKKEITNMTNEQLVEHFDSVCTKLTCEVNTRRGQTKKTTADWEITRAELLRRLGADR